MKIKIRCFESIKVGELFSAHLPLEHTKDTIIPIFVKIAEDSFVPMGGGHTVYAHPHNSYLLIDLEPYTIGELL
jgi:hypothetical protein